MNPDLATKLRLQPADGADGEAISARVFALSGLSLPRTAQKSALSGGAPITVAQVHHGPAPYLRSHRPDAALLAFKRRVEQRLRLRPICPRTNCPQGREGELHETARH